jgi:hypothetical protein
LEDEMMMSKSRWRGKDGRFKIGKVPIFADGCEVCGSLFLLSESLAALDSQSSKYVDPFAIAEARRRCPDCLSEKYKKKEGAE